MMKLYLDTSLLLVYLVIGLHNQEYTIGYTLKHYNSDIADI